MKNLSEKQPIVPQAQVQPPVEVQKVLNKVSVKYNAKSMLDSEVGEAMTEYINMTVMLINQLKAKVAELEAQVKPKETKAE
jgi:hypothetical protein